MELNTIDNKQGEPQQYDFQEPGRRGTILDSWMNDLRTMFGKRKKPPRYEKTETATPTSSNSPMNMNQLKTFSEESRPDPGLQLMSESMFGGHIVDSVDEASGVAKFVLWCVRAIETTGEGLKTDGIYSAIGVQTRVNFITRQDEEVMEKCLSEEKSVFTLAGALKVFFRQLKIPLVDFQQFRRAIEAENAISETRLLVNSLPPAHYNTILFLIRHLSSVLKLHEFNNTSLVELGVIFGPTLMRLSPNCQDMAGELKQQNIIVEFLITESAAIFPHPRDDDESDAEMYKGVATETSSASVASDVQRTPGVTDQDHPHGGDIMEVSRDNSRHVTVSSTKIPPHPPAKPSRLANLRPILEDTHSSAVRPAVQLSDIQTRVAPIKKSRSTPVDSYIQGVSSDSGSDDSVYSDSEEVATGTRSVPTAL